MEKLDINEILKNNPQIDPKEIKSRKKDSEPHTDSLRGNPTSPYGRRRASTDDKMNWREVSHYRSR
jgi:hypothetical protein